MAVSSLTVSEAVREKRKMFVFWQQNIRHPTAVTAVYLFAA